MKNDELISRSALKKDLLDRSFFPAIVKAALENAPAVDAVEVDKAMAWLEGYTMTDTEQIYSNGTAFVPLFRVKQAFVDKAYNGLQEG